MKKDLFFLILIVAAAATALTDIAFLAYLAVNTLFISRVTIPSLFPFALSVTILNGLLAAAATAYFILRRAKAG